MSSVTVISKYSVGSRDLLGVEGEPHYPAKGLHLPGSGWGWVEYGPASDSSDMVLISLTLSLPSPRPPSTAAALSPA